MDPKTIKFLFGYSAWARRQVWGCIEKLTAEEFERELDFSWGSVRKQVLHIMLAESLWLWRIQGNQGWLPFEDSFKTRQEICERWDAIEAMLVAYIEHLDEAELERRIDYRNSRGEQFHGRVGDILLHVVNHGTDHRAQILAMVAVLGGQTVDQDMVYYMREMATHSATDDKGHD